MSRTASFERILADLEAGKLKAAVVVECDGASWSASQLQALSKLDLLVVLDYLTGPLHERAAIFLPTEATYESEGAFVNRAGRLQAFARSRAPGLPVRRLFDGSSFPRAYHTAPPLGDVRA